MDQTKVDLLNAFLARPAHELDKTELTLRNKLVALAQKRDGLNAKFSEAQQTLRTTEADLIGTNASIQALMETVVEFESGKPLATQIPDAGPFAAGAPALG
jgi:hypothetical protein